MPKNNTILLLGAGFSRNWGGWLASEAFEYLLGCPGLDRATIELLWKHKRSGGFEGALSELQEEARHTGTRSERLIQLQSAIQNMFDDMTKAFAGTQFEFLLPTQDYRNGIIYFLSKFDAIFTLNQDLLLEQHYLIHELSLRQPGRWDGVHIPGMDLIPVTFPQFDNPKLGKWKPNSENRKLLPRMQPYFKLHGSCNWLSADNENLLVMGGNKAPTINRDPHLKWSFDQFNSFLHQPDTKLMIIGYSFGDDHINNAIRDAVRNSRVSLFIIDPKGVDIIDKNKGNSIYTPNDLASELWPNVIGSSRRNLSEIFGRDVVEHQKLMRFFG
jgi:hypothetical protein